MKEQSISYYDDYVDDEYVVKEGEGFFSPFTFLCSVLVLSLFGFIALLSSTMDKAIAEGADAFVTGEMHYHEFFGHEQQIQICVIGHYQSEQFTAEIFKEIIEEKCHGVKSQLTTVNTNPILYL